jgi:3-oxoacyl-[acyl-carrier-protein] synthase II
MKIDQAHKAMKRRVVVTGMGLVTPLGSEVSIVWDRLIKGHSGISMIEPSGFFEGFDVSALPSRIAGQVPEEYLVDIVSAKERARIDRFILLGIAAGKALQDAKWLPQSDEEKERTGTYIGAGIGGLPEIEKTVNVLYQKGVRRVSPFFIPASLINLVASHLAMLHQLRGPSLAMATACASGAHSIGEAAYVIERGDADVMVAGGSEASVCPIGTAGFSALKGLSTHFNECPEKASRPFDRDRDGFVIAEGAGILILEEEEHALRRGAKIYGELLGYAATSDAYHITAPSGDGARRCMIQALHKAGLKSQDIGYINAHGTSTPAGDLAELRAVESLFKPEDGVMMSSTKSSIGHSLGAAGSIEAIFILKALETGQIPPTLNLENPEETYIDLVPLVAKMRPGLKHVMSNSFGFGGTNATLIFGRGFRER